jgi:competence protein ComEA
MRKKIKVLPLCLTLALMLCGCGKEQTLTLDEMVAEAEQQDDAAHGQSATGPDSVAPAQSATGPDSVAPDTPAPVFVYVCGAVNNPGVYALPAASRICDALEAAGGFTEEADVNRINLAGALSDGMMLFFPEMGEEIPEGMDAAGTAMGTASGDSVNLGPININTAGVETLCTLPGIGESKAKAIVAYREEHGPFADKSDIKNVSGIGDNLYLKIEDLICV